MKNLLIGLLLALSHAPAWADSVIGSRYVFQIPASQNGGLDVDRKWSLGYSTAVLQASSGRVVVPGVGFITGICVSSGAIGDFAVIFDTANAGGLILLNGTNVTELHRQVTQPLASVTAANAAINEGAGCTNFPDGLPFQRGIAVWNLTTTIDTYIRYRLLRQ